MTLSEIKNILPNLNTVNFKHIDGSIVPHHFHVTEIGLIHKHYIDCGGKVREEKVVSFQLWNADDIDHRLKPIKLLGIISKAESVIGLNSSLEIEVEYQTETIGKYQLQFDGLTFILAPKHTACLASDLCGVTDSALNTSNNSAKCKPNTGCC